MFFNFNKFKYKSETFLQINIGEKNTTIDIYENNKLDENNSITIDTGYKNILEKHDKNLNEYNYNIAYQDALSFMKYIEFQILCYMNLPTKIEDIKFLCDGPKLFSQAFENSFKFYLR